MISNTISNLGTDDNNNFDEAFYKKNPNEEEYFILPLTSLKSDIDSNTIICIFCKNISIIPKTCKDCNSIYCKLCIDKKCNLEEVCPITKTKHNTIDINSELKENFEKIKITCPSRDAKCNKIIYYNEMKEHLSKCKYWRGSFSCLGCEKYEILGEMECHVLICDQINWNCNHCNLPFKRADLASHLEICDMKVIECNKCRQNIQAKDLDKHCSKDECLYSIIMEMKSKFNGKK